MASRNIGMEELLGERDWLRRLAWHVAGRESDGQDLAQGIRLASALKCFGHEGSVRLDVDPARGLSFDGTVDQ
jgi:hypothetical protein